MITTSPVNFKDLPRYQPRQFVADSADLTKQEEVKKYFELLLMEPLRSSTELESWLLKRSELESVLDQQGSILYIEMTCQTDNEEKAHRYTNFIETIPPLVKPLDDQLNKKLLNAVQQFDLDERRFGVYIRGVRTDVELFRQENVSLQTWLDLLSQEYQTVCGAMTVEFEGAEKTLPQMQKYLMEPDRKLREKAWRATSSRRLQDKEKLEKIFSEMLELRHQIARNAGFENYRDYRFKALHRFDYSPEDCRLYHQSVEKAVLPVWKKILHHRCAQMSLSTLRPWDLAVDPLNRPPLNPFSDVQVLVKKSQTIFEKVDKELGEQFGSMAESGMLDLASRKGKAPGGYQSTLNEARQPFIFMNAVGIDDDVRTLLHESGHAFHALAAAPLSLIAYRHAPMEFCEVASMTMELIGGEYLDVFYSSEDMKRSFVSHLEDIVSVLIWVATVDAFQHWIYEHPHASAVDRQAQWLNIRKRFDVGLTDWTGLEEEHRFLWHRQLHIFEVPFYYIEYAIAQLGALQIWFRSQQDREGAIAAYRNALALGGSRPLPELFQTAGVKFDFSQKVIAPLMEAIDKRLELLYQ